MYEAEKREIKDEVRKHLKKNFRELRNGLLVQVYHKQCFSCKRCGRSMDSLAVAVGPGLQSSFFPPEYSLLSHTWSSLQLPY